MQKSLKAHLQHEAEQKYKAAWLHRSFVVAGNRTECQAKSQPSISKTECQAKSQHSVNEIKH